MASLVDTNILIYALDPRSPEKRAIAIDLLSKGKRDKSLRLAHQAIVEFVSVIGRILSPETARREGEELLNHFEVLYPNEAIVRLACRGAAAYGLSWFDAHMWAYAEHHGLSDLWSEDFTHDRMYGTVRTLNPFRRRR